MTKINLPILTNPMLYVESTGTVDPSIDQAIIDRAYDIIITPIITDEVAQLDKLDWANVTLWRICTPGSPAKYFLDPAAAVAAIPAKSSAPVEGALIYEHFLKIWMSAKTYDADIETFADEMGFGKLGCFDHHSMRDLAMTVYTVVKSSEPVRDLLTVSQRTVSQFARAYEIPDSTVRAWVNGVNKPAEWQLKLLTFAVANDIINE